MPEDKWVEIGKVAVDSGRLLISDHCYQDQKAVQDLEDLLEGAGFPDHLSLPFDLGHEGAGISVHAGLGDGLYPVTARYEDVEGWGKRIAEVKITFLPHPVLG